MQKRALAIHDISCVGRCSLTVALPILSAAGVDTGVLPTAVLSTHTGGFTGYTYRDLTEDILPILSHWQSLNLSFDAIYTGYLGSFRQVELVGQVFDAYPDALKFVDPVMADNGVLYSGFSADFPQEMRKLCARADLIIPNVTEATLMLGEPYVAGPYTPAYVEGLLRRLVDLGARAAVLTGVHFDDAQLGAAALENDVVSYAFAPHVDGYFHGTGDVFGSGLLAGLLGGQPLARALQTAVNFTRQSIANTVALKQEARYGVCFEYALPSLMQALA